MTDTPKVVTFKDREIAIKAPSGIQVAAWNRVAARFGEFGNRENAELTEEEGEEFKGLLDRLFRIIASLFSNEADRQWLEDQALDGEVTDEDLLELFEKASEGLKGNAEKGAPAAKKAARRQ